MILTFILGLIGGAAAGIAVMALVAMANDMQELEKILEEIDIKIAGSMGKKREGLLEAEDIIRKHMNDRWISVEECLPEDDVDVLITYADIDDENYTDICITTYGYAYLGGNKLDFKEWRSPFEYFKTNHKVIAWRPLPEPYRPERSDNHDGK